MRAELYNGHSVNIDGFGVFSLSATTGGGGDDQEGSPL